MLINYVHVYKAGTNKVHVQATGDAFPTGYASGNIETSAEVLKECGGKLGRHSPSMRPGSSSRYLPCSIDGDNVVTTGGNVVCTIVALNKALHPPCPQYGDSRAAAVKAQVQATIAEGTKPPVEETAQTAPVSTPDKNEELAKVIAEAVLAALIKFNQ